MTTRTTMIVAVGAALLIGFGAGLAVGRVMPRQPTTRADCYLHYFRSGMTSGMSHALMRSCDAKFPK